jgi:hypothetical protein
LNNLNYDIVISATKDVEHCGGQVNLSTAKGRQQKLNRKQNFDLILEG